MKQSYFVRVVLHKKPLEHPDYTKLHTDMQKAGFIRIIFARDKQSVVRSWVMPPGEYVKVATDSTADLIRDEAKTIASGVDINNGVLVLAYNDATVDGLELYVK